MSRMMTRTVILMLMHMNLLIFIRMIQRVMLRYNICAIKRKATLLHAYGRNKMVYGMLVRLVVVFFVRFYKRIIN